MLKAIGYFLIVLGMVWFVLVAGKQMLDARNGSQSIGAAAGTISVLGLLPLLGLAVVGGLLVAVQNRKDREEKTLEYEKQILGILNKEGRTRFQPILQQMPLSTQELKELLIEIGRKQLFTGWINWKEQQITSSEVMEEEIPRGECPFCNSLMSDLGKRESVCTRCEAHVFYPVAEKRSDRS